MVGGDCLWCLETSLPTKVLVPSHYFMFYLDLVEPDLSFLYEFSCTLGPTSTKVVLLDPVKSFIYDCHYII